MKLYLLWFNEWEANYVLGMFETYAEAERWKAYFIANPLGGKEEFGYCSDMKHYSEKRNGQARNDYETRFEIEEAIVGQLHEGIKVDNLKLLEWEASKNAKANTQSISEGH